MRIRILLRAMRRVLAILIFAVAAAAATAAVAGVAVAPHVDPPGTPMYHTHVLAAYRLPIFLGVLRARYDPHQGLVTTTSVLDLESTLVLALLALVWPRLPRPALLAVADVGPRGIARALWRAPHLTGPPRRSLPI
jgi:hypothetical protein